MCNVCGCGEENHTVGISQSHGGEGHVGDSDGAVPLLHFGNNRAGVTVAGQSEHQLVELQHNLMQQNDGYAQRVRAYLKERNICSFNLLSSPGSGKTSLLTHTLQQLLGQECYVIEGDQQTRLDAERIAAAGAKALQVNTGKGCHLDAHMIWHGLEKLDPTPGSLLFVENVGNLVCPAGFDLGETRRVVLLSVTEGDDKPLKYPDAFHSADLVVITKVDLLAHVDFQSQRCRAWVKELNPDVEIMEVSVTSGSGIDDWLEWVLNVAR